MSLHLIVRYNREAYVSRSGLPLRLTIDRDVRSAPHPMVGDLFRSQPMRDVFPGHAVLEAKFPRQMPPWLASMVDRFGYEREAVSKYTYGLESAGVASAERKSRATPSVTPTDRDPIE